MDWQTAFNIGTGLIAFMGGWMINRITSMMDRLDEDIRKMPMYYVTKEDYRRDIDELKSICNQIFKKLEHKVDR